MQNQITVLGCSLGQGIRSPLLLGTEFVGVGEKLFRSVPLVQPSYLVMLVLAKILLRSPSLS